MATKLEKYIQMAGNTAAEVTKNAKNWTGFLDTAANLYRYSFPDQLLIHAQRSNVKACADFDVWTKRMKYYVRGGSKGIALVNMKNGHPSLRYVFDIKDTGRKKDSQNLYLWKYKEEYQDMLTKALTDCFGIACSDGLVVQLCHIATHLAKDYWKNYHQDIICEMEGSMLEGLDEQSLRSRFCKAAAFSITYILLLRCGFNPNNYLSQDVFQGISDFNTQRITKMLGHVVSEASGNVLHQLAIFIFDYERQKQAAAPHSNKPVQQDSNKISKEENKKKPSSFVITVDSAEKKQAPQPSIKDIYEQYKPIVKDFLLKDRAYLNACKNSDKENAFMEGLEAVKRAALSIKDLEFMKLFYDLAEFHNRMQQEILAETYPELSKVQEKHQGKEKPEAVATKLDSEENAAEEPEAVVTESEKSPESEPESPDTGTDFKDSPAAEPEPETPDAASQPQPVIVMNESGIEELPPAHPVSNYRITDDHLGDGSAKDKYTFNMYSIIMLKQIESENRAATPGEQDVLAHYVGWGGIPDVFDEEKAGWEKEYQEL